MKALGKHILIELYDCDVEILNDVPAIQKAMDTAAELANATIVKSVFHHFSPHGVSGVVVIQESHLAIHTWPEHGYAAVDIFTCGDTLEASKASDFLEKSLKAKRIESKNIDRGLLNL
ncbi:MAG: adenosylmethionine decarboxylase [Saprospiraceae bacterium]